MISISMISAAYTQAFLDAFASLGIEPWAGIEMDVAWGQTTLRFGLHRPSVTGQTGRCSPLLAQVFATVPSFGASQTGRCSPLLEVFSGVCVHGVPTS